VIAHNIHFKENRVIICLWYAVVNNEFDGAGNEHLIRLFSSSEVVCIYLSSSMV
jgi:hypothetical protein